MRKFHCSHGHCKRVGIGDGLFVLGTREASRRDRHSSSVRRVFPCRSRPTVRAPSLNTEPGSACAIGYTQNSRCLETAEFCRNRIHFSRFLRASGARTRKGRVCRGSGRKYVPTVGAPERSNRKFCSIEREFSGPKHFSIAARSISGRMMYFTQQLTGCSYERRTWEKESDPERNKVHAGERVDKAKVIRTWL